jgi:hypothetical protein
MRILCVVLLALAVLVGAALGGVTAWSATAGPMSERIARLADLVTKSKDVGKLGNVGLMKGMTMNEGNRLLEQGLRGYRVAQFGGAAIAILDITLLVLVFMRRSKPVLVAAGLALAVGVVCFALTPSRAVDEALHTGLVILEGSVVSAALFAFLADRAGRRAALAGGSRRS